MALHYHIESNFVQPSPLINYIIFAQLILNAHSMNANFNLVSGIVFYDLILIYFLE